MTTVAIVGRPNVGKSTLFNRLLRRRIAIVDCMSGTTRDRIYGEVEWRGNKFSLIDTGGIDFGSKDLLQKKVLEQIRLSIMEADIVIFVTDVRDGVTPLDREIARLLRKSGKCVIVGVNKVDNEELGKGVYAFSSLGWDRLVGISALHGLGINTLLDMIPIKRSSEKSGDGENLALKVAVVGRPNVGKSTFINAVLDKPRMIVDEKPGTTRDSVDVRFKRGGNTWVFIDTAGIRKPRKIKLPVEYYSVRRAFKSIDRADVVILMIDGWEGMTRQEMQLIDYIVKKEKPCIIAVNKWDLVKVHKRDYRERLIQRLAEYWYIPAVFISALKRENLDKLLDKVEDIFGQFQKKIPTGQLNKVVHSFLDVKIFYGTQIGISPPSFLFFNKGTIDKDGISYVKNQMHKAFGFEVPIRIEFRGKF